MNDSENKLTAQHLELLKSFKYLRNEQQIKEVKELLNFYYRQKLDMAIDEVEASKGYTAAIYEAWLRDRTAPSA